jgi:hypothetical protein
MTGRLARIQSMLLDGESHFACCVAMVLVAYLNAERLLKFKPWPQWGMEGSFHFRV